MRLNEIIQKHPSTLNNSDSASIIEFTRIMRDTRNYHTHYGKIRPRTLVINSKILTFSHGLRYVLEVVIMNEMGFTDDQILALSKLLKFELRQNWIQNIVNYCKKQS